MTDRPRRTLQQMAQESAERDGRGAVQIAGKPAGVCPHCGAGMFINRTTTLQTRVERYERCRACQKTFVAHYPPEPQGVIVREVGADDEDEGEYFSSGGKSPLTLVRRSG